MFLHSVAPAVWFIAFRADFGWQCNESSQINSSRPLFTVGLRKGHFVLLSLKTREWFRENVAEKACSAFGCWRHLAGTGSHSKLRVVLRAEPAVGLSWTGLDWATGKYCKDEVTQNHQSSLFQGWSWVIVCVETPQESPQAAVRKQSPHSVLQMMKLVQFTVHQSYITQKHAVEKVAEGQTSFQLLCPLLVYCASDEIQMLYLC